MHSPTNFRYKGLQPDDIEQIARIYQRRLLAQRIRRVAKVAIIATKTNTSSRKRKLLFYKRRMQANIRLVQQNQYRIVAASFVAVLVLTTFVAPLIQATDTKPVKLDSKVSALLGDVRDDAKDYLKYDDTKKLYSFEAPAQDTSTNYNHTGRNVDAYTTTMPTDASQGITVTETKTKIAVTLVPDFFTAPGRKSTANNLVYQSGSRQVIYSLKYNGLKEDIIIPKFQGPSVKYSFKLQLPTGVEARLDDQGNIGIYSADPTLYGDISFGSDQDRARIDKARENSAKTNLVMTIPYPVIKDSTGTEYTDRASFELGAKQAIKTKVAPDPNLPADVQAKMSSKASANQYDLTLKAYNLRGLSYPLSLDPTMQVASAADFSKMNLDGGADLDTTNSLIKRTALTGGAVGTVTDDTIHTLNIARYDAGMAYMNGYLYVVGGWQSNRSVASEVSRATIDTTTGTISSWSTSNIPYGVADLRMVAYNGRLYIVGGATTNSYTPTANVYTAKPNSDGSIPSWTAANNTGFTARYGIATAVYNNIIYAINGATDASTVSNLVQYTTINADGTLANWLNVGTINGRSATVDASAFIYNGYLYIGGGNDGSSTTPLSTISYIKINSDGTLPANGWAVASTSMSFGAAEFDLTAYGGYVYAVGGCNGYFSKLGLGSGCSTFTIPVLYAPLYANGDIGTWQQSNRLNRSREGTRSTVVNGVVVAVGGCGIGNSVNAQCNNAAGSNPSIENDVDIAQVKPAGELGTWATTSSFATARWATRAVAMNGYIYIAGGMTTACSPICNATTNVQYAAINTDGTIPATGAGSWAATTSFPAALAAQGMVAVNGYLYAIGGAASCTFTNGVAICSGLTTVYYIAQTANGTLGSTWTATSALNNGRFHEGVAAYGGRYIYAAGGSTCSGTSCSPENTIEYAAINTDGTLSSWSQVGTTPNVMGAGAVVIYGNYFYVVGGEDTNNTLVYYAPLKADGTFASGAIQATSLPTGFYYVMATAVKGYMYAYQGNANTIVVYAKINTDGSLGAWQTTSSYANTRYQFAGAFYGDKLYVLGGAASNGSSTMYNDVQVVNINNGGLGVTGSWSSSASSLSVGRGFFRSAVVNGYVYLISGNSGGVDTNLIEYTTINSAGDIGSWAPANSTNFVGGDSFDIGAVNGRIYVVGGSRNGTWTDDVQYTDVHSDGTVGNWAVATAHIGGGLAAHSVVAWGGRIYMLGGSGGNAAGVRVVYATPDPTTGDFAAWVSTTQLPIVMYSSTAIAKDGYVYIFGGTTNSSSGVVYTANVYSSKVNSDGSLASWVQQQSMPTPFAFSSAVFSGGFVYNVGGYTGSSSPRRSYSAPLISNGGVGQWQVGPAYNGTNNSLGGAAFTTGAKVYFAGGCSDGGCSGASSDVVQAGFQYISRKAQFSKLYDFDVGVKPTRLITRGAKQTGTVVSLGYTSSNGSSTALDNAQSVTDTGYGGGGSQTLSLGTNRTLSRYLFLKYAIDDGPDAFFPDDSTQQSTITDFDLYYIANPGNRLRGGQTFTNGADRGLDAQPQ